MNGYLDLSNTLFDEDVYDAVLDCLNDKGITIVSQERLPHDVWRLEIVGPTVTPGALHMMTCHRHEDGTVTAELNQTTHQR